MIRLHLLGPLSLLNEEGASVGSLLAQPKRFALLSYLAASPDSSAHRRDTLLALLWPELDDERARNALRQTLFGLRRSLGPGVVAGEGDELVHVDPDRLWCDASRFEAAVRDGRDEEALELYRGPLLDGFHLSGAPAFERWLEGERRRLRMAATDAAWRLTARPGNDRAASRRWAERAVELAPYDEEGLRRYLALMAEHGQPAAAIRAFEAFAARLAADLELEPSAETADVVAGIRAGHTRADESAPDAIAAAQAASVDASARPPAPHASPAPSVAAPTASVAAPASSAPATASPTRRSWLRLAIAGGVGALAVGAWALGLAVERNDPFDEIRRVAVLPLANLTGDPEQEYFVAGMHDALVAELGRVADLMVVSRQSVLRYQGSERPLREIARELGVDAVVEGSVFRGGDSVRITAQLVRVAPEAHLWSDSYQGALGEALALQGSVARAVSEAVLARLTPETEARLAASPSVTPRAQEAYLRGLYDIERVSLGTLGSLDEVRETLRAGIAHLEEAVALEPEWAAAHAKLALGYHWLASAFPEAEAEFYPMSKEAALRALELDENEAQAHASLGFVLLFFEHDWTGAERSIRRALELDPNAHHSIYGLYLRAAGRYDEALTQFRRAEERNPLSRRLKREVVVAYFCAGRYDEAVSQAEHVSALWPDLERTPMRGFLGNVYTATSRHAEAIAAFEEAVALSDSAAWAVAGLGYVRARAGAHDEARALLAWLAERRPGSYHPMLHLALGETERAAETLEAAFDERGLRALGDMPCFPEWETLRAHPRIREMLDEMGLAT